MLNALSLCFSLFTRYLIVLCVLLGSQFTWAEQANYQTVMAELIDRGDRLVERYDPKQAVRFGDQFSQLYFGGFEGQGLEFAVGQADQDAMLEIELDFSRLINAAVTGATIETVLERWQSLRAKLIAAPMLTQEDSGFWATVLQSFLILLREGIEALLVVAALVTYLRKGGAADRVPWVWAGVVAALVASVVTAIALQTLIQNSGAARETIEGATMLLAAVLLAYVSFWLFSKREMQQWQGFIKDKLGEAVSTGSLFAVVSTAFLAVYREGAETILFYQALVVDMQASYDALITGFVLAAVVLLFVYIAIFKLSVTLPLKQFFSATALLLFCLAIIFAGKSMLELQVAGWVSNTYLEFAPTVSWLGVFPTAESILAQFTFLIVPLVAYFVWKQSQGAGAISQNGKESPRNKL